MKVTLVVLAVLVALVAFAPPVVQGFHLGCSASTGDTLKMVRLGIEFCK